MEHATVPPTDPPETTTTAPEATPVSEPSAEETPTSVPAETTVVPQFAATVHEIDSDIAARMSQSWREGCPVELADLRLIEMTHFNYEGEVATGELVVHSDQVDAIVGVFEQLFELAFPIEQMRLVDEFGADDTASMQANNTSAFNCRFVAGTTRWSEHAFGRAIDVNPLVNPWVQGSRVSPPEGAEYVDRTQDYPGLIKADDEVVAAFAAAGWSWGGSWSSSKDYQHFSATGD